ncbi:MAG: hypothetical protein ACTS3T_20380 [Almyronema sp.]
MEIEEQVNQQRVKHVIDSYQLFGEEWAAFEVCLDRILQRYPTPLVELALTEILVQNWLRYPLVRGLAFLNQVHEKLKTWETQPITSAITPIQFQLITGLDPSPIFALAYAHSSDAAAWS